MRTTSRRLQRAAELDRAVIDSTLTASLDSLEDADNYRQWIIHLLDPALEGPILEVGAGHGTFTDLLAERGSVHAVEPSSGGAAVLSDRFADDPRIRLTEGVVGDLAETPTYSSAVMINVLEHIDDHIAVLREIRQRLVPGGHVAIWVPAFESLYSPFDLRLGHYRRYGRRELCGVVEQAGYIVEAAHYANLPGWFSWLIVARWMRREPIGGPLVAVFDRFIVPIVRFVEARINPPFGQSVVLIGRNPIGADG